MARALPGTCQGVVVVSPLICLDVDTRADHTKAGKPKPVVTRDTVLHWADVVGTNEAASRFGVSIRTVFRWKAEAMMHGEVHNEEAIAKALDAKPWLDRRDALGDRFGAVAERAVALAMEMIASGDAGEAQKALVSAGIATDKAQLLRGGPTKRSEHTVSLDSQVTRLMDALDAMKKGTPALPVAGEVVLDLESDVEEAEVVEREDT